MSDFCMFHHIDKRVVREIRHTAFRSLRLSFDSLEKTCFYSEISTISSIISGKSVMMARIGIISWVLKITAPRTTPNYPDAV